MKPHLFCVSEAISTGRMLFIDLKYKYPTWPLDGAKYRRIMFGYLALLVVGSFKLIKAGYNPFYCPINTERMYSTCTFNGWWDMYFCFAFDSCGIQKGSERTEVDGGKCM